jgi:methylmalonyl-CoA carboxyltransferase 1.3S subunit
MKVEVVFDGKMYEIDLVPRSEVHRPKRRRKFLQSSVVPMASAHGMDGDGWRICRSPVTGIVRGVHVQVGDELQPHDLMLVVEAMKMQTKLTAPTAGKLKCVNVAPGQAVKINQVLLEFE